MAVHPNAFDALPDVRLQEISHPPAISIAALSVTSASPPTR